MTSRVCEIKGREHFWGWDMKRSAHAFVFPETRNLSQKMKSERRPLVFQEEGEKGSLAFGLASHFTWLSGVTLR